MPFSRFHLPSTPSLSRTGIQPQTKVAELLVNQPATVDFTVTVQASQEIVNVSAMAQTLNTTDASLGSSMNNTLIQALPSEGRNVPDLLSLQPGVLYLGQNSGRPSNPTLANDPRSGAVNGGRSDQGNITVDGIDDNDQVNGYAFTGVLRETQDSVEEFRVTTGLAGADQGRSSGAQVSMVTKSGTNKYHGAVYWYNRPTLTVANDWFNKEAAGQQRPPQHAAQAHPQQLWGCRRRPHPQRQVLLFRKLRSPAASRKSDRQQNRSHRQLPAGNHQLSGDDAPAI